MTNFDAIVVGGGVAGSATAIELMSAGLRVAVLERTRDESWLETLSPAATQALGRLRIALGVPLPEISAWWGSGSVARVLQPQARIVQRAELARALRSRAREVGASSVECRQILSLDRSKAVWTVHFADAERNTRRLTASAVIDASGRPSTIGRRLGARRLNDDALVCASVTVLAPGRTGVWTETAPDGWWNLCCTEAEGTLSFYSSPSIVRDALHGLPRRFAALCRLPRLATPSFKSIRVRPCNSSRLVPCAKSGWVAVGDAARTVQPLASAGIALAVRDAAMALGGLVDPTAYEEYHAVSHAQYLDNLREHYGLESRWKSQRFWRTQRAAAAVRGDDERRNGWELRTSRPTQERVEISARNAGATSDPAPKREFVRVQGNDMASGSRDKVACVD